MAYTRDEFVIKYGSTIEKAVKGTGILPGTVIAQAILESSGTYNGEWLVGGSGLARNANNYFGIKADRDWDGAVYTTATGEYDKNGKYYTLQGAKFRKYNSVGDSIKDYVKFLKSNSRYENAGVFKAKTVKEQAAALQKAGYATAPTYADTVSSVYESIKSTIKEAQEKSMTFVKEYWVGIALVTVGIVGITYYYINTKNK